MLDRVSHLLIISALIFCFSFLFTSCSSVKFLKAEKIKVLPGVPTGTPVFRYNMDVKVSKSTKFLSLNINGLEEILTFSVTDLKTNLQSDNIKVYAPGIYKIQLSKSKTLGANEKIDVIAINCKQKNRVFEKKIKVKKAETIRLR